MVIACRWRLRMARMIRMLSNIETPPIATHAIPSACLLPTTKSNPPKAMNTTADSQFRDASSG